MVVVTGLLYSEICYRGVCYKNVQLYNIYVCMCVCALYWTLRVRHKGCLSMYFLPEGVTNGIINSLINELINQLSHTVCMHMYPCLSQ